MTAVDLLVTNARVHTLAGDPAADADPDAEAVAVRDGRVVGVGSAYDLGFRADVETRVVDVEGRVVLPGFVDAHTHLTALGRRLVHADLGGAADREEALDRLRERAGETDGWVLGVGYDESAWDGGGYLTRDDLDAVSADRPVVAVREDMHVASLNGVALDRLREDLPDRDVQTGPDGPTGVVVEAAVEAVEAAIAPDATETRALVEAAQAHAVARGVTGVHDVVRRSHTPRVYRDMAAAGDLDVRVRLNYTADHLDALTGAGLATGHGTEMVRVGAVKAFADGSIGGRTARLSRPYADAPAATAGLGEAAGTGADGTSGDAVGTWLLPPDELRDLVVRADAAGFQVAVHAIGDRAVDAALDAFAAVDAPGTSRHRVEHAELASDDAIERMAGAGIVASVQPNFHRWSGPDGLYAARLGDRWRETNRLATLEEAGVRLAFGSDCIPLDPLAGIHHAVTAPVPAGRLDVGRAVRAYTRGGAYAGFDEGRAGTLTVGGYGDLVALDRSPWDNADALDDVTVDVTVVDGRVVYDDR
jgi:hypothetical protein